MSKNKQQHPPKGFAARSRQWRRNNRRRFNQLLARLLGTPEARRRPLAADTRRILVVRLNKRLGNILFLTPMLRSLAATLPEARIDVVIQSQAQQKLLQTLPGVDRVWIQEPNLFGTLRLLRRLRRRRYDLTIDPTGNSASNRIAVALVRTRQRLGFAKNDQWLPLTHAAGRPSSRHQALQAVELLRNAISEPPVTTFDTLAVFPNETDREAAEAHWHNALGRYANSGAPVVGFFSRATGRKALRPHWWQAWILEVRRAAPQVVLLEILPDDNADPIVPEIAHIAVKPLTELAAVISRMDQFVAADSGPMHLAAAAGTPVIGLFRATRPSDYAPLGQHCTTIEGQALTPAGVAGELARRLNHGDTAPARVSGARE
ncbi:glycosyltransferase family 9 protein [Salinisphaera sp. SPP-AMP-43]|uniref:glycosyltransferase family 9 protein n=1 Tax=Salinisphaera sp. SPP-AMP-43 TaxID=3121288 RepID=UPI003C6E8270